MQNDDGLCHVLLNDEVQVNFAKLSKERVVNDEVQVILKGCPKRVVANDDTLVMRQDKT